MPATTSWKVRSTPSTPSSLSRRDVLMTGILYRSFLPVQRELSHKRYLFHAGPGNRGVGVTVGQGSAKFNQRNRLQAASARQGDEWAYGTNGHRAALSRGPRTNPIMHQHDCPRQKFPGYPGDHFVWWSSSPILGVSGPADEGQPVFTRPVLGRRRLITTRGPPDAHGTRQR